MAQRYAKDMAPGSSNVITRVAIVGAGGQLGKHLAAALVSGGKHTITVLQRKESRSRIADGLRVVHVDYNDEQSLVTGLQGQQALVVTMSVMAPRDTVSKLIHAASKAGVSYILPNWYGQDPANDSLCKDAMLGTMRDGIIAGAAQAGIAYILLACNFWYEFSLGGGPNRYGFDFTERSLVLFDGGYERINTTTWPQCGRAVASLLALKQFPDNKEDKSVTLSQFANGPVYISSFLLSQNEMFDTVKRVTKTSDADWHISHGTAEQRWKESLESVQGGNWSAFTKMLYSRVWCKDGGGDFESHGRLDNHLLGLPTEELDEATAEAVRMGLNNEVPFGH